MEDFDKIKQHLNQLIKLVDKNIEKADNIDLYDMSDNLQQMLDIFESIKGFERYE